MRMRHAHELHMSMGHGAIHGHIEYIQTSIRIYTLNSMDMDYGMCVRAFFLVGLATVCVCVCDGLCVFCFCARFLWLSDLHLSLAIFIYL
jgi:hypothetical protein